MPGITQTSEILHGLVTWVSKRCDIDVTTVDPARPVTTLGLDSLKSAELAEHVERTFGHEIIAEEMFDGLTLGRLADDIATTISVERSRSADNEPPTTNGPGGGPRTSTGATGSGRRTIDVSLLFFASDAQRDSADRYSLFMDSVRFADEHGFEAVWIPERHFHTFGGLFPNPSVLASAAAVSTSRVRLRAGSVVLPLHDPLRVAEEWAVVDNLSHGRVDLAFATGWSPDDFVLAPEHYADRERAMLDGVAQVQRLWSGGQLTRQGGTGDDVAITVFPRPVQPSLSTWLTCTSSVERFVTAGQLGANVLTALLFQDVGELAERVSAYRKARAAAGYDPTTGRVTLMLHTFLGDDEKQVRRVVEEPFKRYLEDSVDLWRRRSEDLEALDPTQRARVLDHAFERYRRTSALVGTPEGVRPLVERVADAGIDEIAALVDFGVPDHHVRRGLDHLDRLRRTFAEPTASQADLAQHAAGTDTMTAETEPPDPNLTKLLEERHRHPRGASDHVFSKARAFRLVTELQSADLMPYYRPVQNDGTTCRAGERRLLMLGSNDYLGLTADRRVREAVAAAALADGSSLSGSAMQNGTTPRHIELERRMASFVGREDAVLFTTGYQANIGLLSAVMGKGTTLVVDDECHASIYDGAGVGGCRVIAFRHNDVADLEQKLRDGLDGQPAMVMTDGVFSMSGDLAALPEIRSTCDRLGVPLAMDDAHGLGMIGETGRGVEEMLDLVGACDVLTGTFSKSLASIGGWVAGDHDLMDWIRFHGRSAMFSASMPPPALAAVDCSLDILQAEPWRIVAIRENADYLRAGLRSQGFEVGSSASAIVPVIIGDELRCLRFGVELFAAGLNVNTVLAPAVPANKALLRASVMATHEKDHLDEALDIFGRVGRDLGVVR
ncbi:hypothetical protein DMP17_44685 [Pseudonocardia sp. TMWB2A]|uniref:MupA/Atu3671 family FMN-dependent luciferase-like monooxygenase n=1 Tax=Pseudonocardia sp. TMWB2A TaxID=687430 RepID=UPI00307CD384